MAIIVSSPHASAYPDSPVLTGVLTKLFKGTGSQPSGVVILSREEFRGSTFPVEVVTCRLPDGRTLRMFCKYEAGRSHEGYGHRGGVTYEADVYATVLASSPCSAPAFFGRHRDLESGDTWLFIEKLEGKSIANTHRPDSIVALREAAKWVGRFHADFATRATRYSTIKRHEAGYYHGFVDRVIEFSKDHHRRYPWLGSVCSRADEVISQLVSVQPTIVHGEFYPGNIIYDNGRICPVDWESTAVASGELDLAALTEGWSPPLVEECEREYAAARWPDGAPPQFERTLAAARLCWAFRWLGDSRSRFQHHRKSEVRLARMFEEARRWPLIS